MVKTINGFLFSASSVGTKLFKDQAIIKSCQ